jgi:hypothetical protein
MSQQTSSRSSGNAAKTGAYIGAAVYLVTHLIPMSGYKHVLDWMHSSVMSLLNVTPNKIAGSAENLTGAAIYVLGWGVFAALGAAVGAVFGGQPVEGSERAHSAESASTNLPRPERDARTASALNADDKVRADAPSSAVKEPAIETEPTTSTTVPQPAKEPETPSSTPLGEALGAGAAGGAAAGLAAHYFAGGKLTFPIFIVVYVLMLSQLKGSGKVTGLVSFVIVGSLVLAIMKHLAG